MIRQPRTVVEVRPHDKPLAVEGHHQARSRRLAEQCLQSLTVDAADSPERRLACQVVVHRAPPLHIGLGTGTQLALAISRALCEAWQAGPWDAGGQAGLLGRGRRARVGTHGFAHGGLVADFVDEADGQPAPQGLVRLDVPAHWVVVVIHCGARGLFGQRERAAFAETAGEAERRTRSMRLACDHILASVRNEDFRQFGLGVYEFGQLAGQTFRRAQGGVFNGPAVQRAAEWLRREGIVGVGQSSWGPCVYGWLDDERHAEWIVERTRRQWPTARVWATGIDNAGARVVRHRVQPDDQIVGHSGRVSTE